jgi:curved DNA-binding protein CbpA
MLRHEDVSSIYKKAVVKLHPDKNHNKDYLTKYLSKRIFELLN